MTYSITARCPRTGEYGVAVATYSPTVGNSVPLIVPGCGAVAYQLVASLIHRKMAADLLAGGASAASVLADLAVKDPFWEHRQVSLVDTFGGVAAYTGSTALPHAGHMIGQGFVAAGNVVTDVCVGDAFAEFEETQESELSLAERLMRALEAGARSGGQKEGLTSAALLVYGNELAPLVDLRVDLNVAPVIELRRVWEFIQPLVPF